MAHLTDYNTEKKYDAMVKKTERLTPDASDEIREISLEIMQPDFECQVDQSVGVLVAPSEEFGNTHHLRLYSVADIPVKENGKTNVKLLVKRCAYVDDFSGEVFPGVGSNYLCDRKVGDTITITGPFDLPFSIPEDKTANIILIGMGTGIAPFRAFIKHIYNDIKNWEGKIRLFYGAKTGLELLYMNDRNNDLANYYDEDTFKAFHALSPRPSWSDFIALGETIESRAEEIIEMLLRSNTYIFVAGYDKVKYSLDDAFSNILGSKQKWETRKAEMIAGKKWAEVIY